METCYHEKLEKLEKLKSSHFTYFLFYEREFENDIIFYSENTLKIKLKNEFDRKWMCICFKFSFFLLLSKQVMETENKYA